MKDDTEKTWSIIIVLNCLLIFLDFFEWYIKTTILLTFIKKGGGKKC